MAGLKRNTENLHFLLVDTLGSCKDPTAVKAHFLSSVNSGLVAELSGRPRSRVGGIH